MSARRLSDTAVTPSDCSIENATVSEYEGSLPTSVMSVPCSVVTTCGARAPSRSTRGSARPGTRRSRAARRSARGRCRGRTRARPARCLFASDEQVLRLAEQRIGRRVDPLKRQARLVLASRNGGSVLIRCTSWPRAASALRQLGGDDAAAADRGVTDDADVHGRALAAGALTSRKMRSRSTGSRTTMPSANATPASAPNCASRLSISCWKRGAVSRVATLRRLGRRELAAVAGERLALALVVRRDVDDERRAAPSR